MIIRNGDKLTLLLELPVINCIEDNIFLKRITTDGEKLFVYNDDGRKGYWTKRGEATSTAAKTNAHQKKIILSIKVRIGKESFIMSFRQVNFDGYYRQLAKFWMNRAIKQKRPKFVFFLRRFLFCDLFRRQNLIPNLNLGKKMCR